MAQERVGVGARKGQAGGGLLVASAAGGQLRRRMGEGGKERTGGRGFHEGESQSERTLAASEGGRGGRERSEREFEAKRAEERHALLDKRLVHLGLGRR